jgi:nitrogen fixation protein NifU and related proteins
VNISDELYQQTILDYNRNPRNFRKIENPTHQAHGFNPLCGDDYTVYMNVGDDRVISDASFDGHGCAISKASASIMTLELVGKTIDDAHAMFTEFQNMTQGEASGECDHCGSGKLCVFSGVWKYPERVKCAILAWHAMESALQGDAEACTE